MSDVRFEAYKIVDNYLKYLSANDGGSVYDISDDFYSTPSQMAFDIMCDNGLINFRKGYRDVDSIIDISHKGASILELGGWAYHVEQGILQQEKEERTRLVEIEKTQTDLLLAKRMLKEYPVTKWMARIGFIVALGLAILEVYKFVS